MIDMTSASAVRARTLDLRIAQPRFGLVTSVDAQKNMARVSIQPDGTLSGWLPILSPWIGNGWGVVCLPAPGDQVVILPCSGSLEQGVIVGRCFSNKQLPPVVPIGELWVTHSSGTSVKLTNEGHVVVVGDLYVSGDVYDQRGSMADIRNYHNTHTHLDSRGGVTTVPTKTE